MNVITYHDVINENLHVHTCIMNVITYHNVINEKLEGYIEIRMLSCIMIYHRLEHCHLLARNCRIYILCQICILHLLH